MPKSLIFILIVVNSTAALSLFINLVDFNLNVSFVNFFERNHFYILIVFSFYNLFFYLKKMKLEKNY
jgi:hypothetical protein